MLLLAIAPLAGAGEEKVGDWFFESRSSKGSYTAFTASASGNFGESQLILRASPLKQGTCNVQLGYSLFGPYAVELKGREAKARVDRDPVRSIRFNDEQSGRTREGVKFSTGFIDLGQREAQNLVTDMQEGKWLRLRFDEKSKIDRFSLYGFSRAARAIYYFCKTPNIKDRYPLEFLLQKLDDEDYL